ncbi:MAG: DUF969 domain-containing protein [Caulobacterales bacterium]|nr:DUF969 domain-containing protein [Caulobacterales bacterium]
MWVLLGVAVVVVGFAARLNPLLIVAAAAIVTGLAAGMDLLATLSVLGKAFRDNRYISVVWLILPLIGLLEREGLQERAKALIGRLREATAGRLLVIYLIIRQLAAAVGLTSLGGHAQMVRPLIAPMAEAAAETQAPDLTLAQRERVKAMAAATDNVGLFFGEDIFIAIASILLIKGFLEENGIVVEPLQLSLWAIPTAILALLIHGARLLLLDRRLAKAAGQ